MIVVLETNRSGKPGTWLFDEPGIADLSDASASDVVAPALSVLVAVSTIELSQKECPAGHRDGHSIMS